MRCAEARETVGERCRVCGAALVLETVDLRGRFERYSVGLIGLPLLRCAEGHDAREPEEGFMVALGQQLRFEHDLFTRRVGFFRRRDVCRRCGGEVNPNAVVSHRIEVDLEHGAAAPYRVEVSAPLVRCRECSAPQIPDRDEHYVGIERAILEALGLGGVRYEA